MYTELVTRSSHLSNTYFVVCSLRFKIFQLNKFDECFKISSNKHYNICLIMNSMFILSRARSAELCFGL